jgi:hypothetical protein
LSPLLVLTGVLAAALTFEAAIDAPGPFGADGDLALEPTEVLGEALAELAFLAALSLAAACEAPGPLLEAPPLDFELLVPDLELLPNPLPLLPPTSFCLAAEDMLLAFDAFCAELGGAGMLVILWCECCFDLIHEDHKSYVEN